jgi:hypothetical protein
MRVFSLTIVALLITWSPSEAHVRQSRRLQDESASPTDTPEFDGGELTTAPTPAGTVVSSEGGTGDGGDLGGVVNVPTPAPIIVDGLTPAPIIVDGLTPAPADDLAGTPVPVDEVGDDVSAPPTQEFGGDAGDLTPSPTPVGTGTVEEPTYAQPTYDEPTYEQPTYDEPTHEQPTYDEPTYEQPTYLTDAPAFPTTPVQQPTEPPALPYVANDDDPLQDEENEIEETKWDNETIEEMEHDQNVLIALSVVGAIGLCFALLAAQQLIENPEGCCA